MFFYMISGFLMAFVLKNNYPATSSGTLKFYQSRFVRIFSLFWPVMVAALLLGRSSLSHLAHGGPLNMFTSTFLFGVDWNVAFGLYPVQNWDATVANLEQSWTLGAELTFYVLAPLILRSRFAVLSLLGFSAVIRALTVHKFGFDNVWTYQFFPATVLFFLLGAVPLGVAEKFTWLERPVIGVTLLAAVPALLMYPEYAYWDTLRFWVAYLCFAIALPSIFSATKTSRVLNALGALSYPVYLTHVLVIKKMEDLGWTTAITDYFGLKMQSGWMILVSALLIMLTVGYAVHRLVEVRAAKLMHAIIDFFLSHGHKVMSATKLKTTPRLDTLR